ncbi:hypothetical protein [uncultured Amphritea sp.]|uniref:hypothetical protein n=1 Tax=uncultured Amphritea sp. TaxID=981605 RepID=UPI00260DDA10|nr:hypothetical protein [uncultured Amphritea sp.]
MTDLFGTSLPAQQHPVLELKELVERDQGKAALKFLASLNKKALHDTLLIAGLTIIGHSSKEWLYYCQGSLLRAIQDHQLPRSSDSIHSLLLTIDQ